MNIKLPFGLRGDTLVHINEITEDERGLKCNCLCPKCKGKLSARIGEKNIKHFAHKSEECSNALETALHLYAKDVISEEMHMVVPKGIFYYAYDSLTIDDFSNSPISSHDDDITCYYVGCDKDIMFDEIILEKDIDDIRPDIIAMVNNTKLLIEIAVTHFVDEEKLEKIKAKNISCIEIELDPNKLSKDNFDKSVVKNLILNSLDNKRWIFNTKVESLKYKIIDDNRKRLECNDKLRQNRENKVSVIQAYKKYNRMLVIANKVYEKQLNGYYKNRCKESTYWISFISNNNLDIHCIPPFLNFKIENNFCFNCDHKIWQSKIFMKFINNHEGESVKIGDIVLWIRDSNSIPYFNDFLYTKDVAKRGYFKDVGSVLDSYFSMLEEYAFVEKINFEEGFYAEYEILKGYIDLSENGIITVKKMQWIEKRRASKGISNVVHKSLDKTFKCCKCKNETDDWIIANGDGTCICRSCHYN